MSEHSNCDTIVHQLLEVEAQVTVTPLIKHEKPTIFCVETEVKPGRNSKEKEKKSDTSGKCTFTVTQVICVEIPLMFGVEVDINDGGIDCGAPKVGPCTVKPNPHEPE